MGIGVSLEAINRT